MNIREVAASFEDSFLETLEQNATLPRTLDIVQAERQLHFGSDGKRKWTRPRGLTRWSKKHAKEVPHVGALPYLPSIFPDQMINRPTRPITDLSIYLPETTYLKGFKKFFDISVGSKDVADSIIDGFNTASAYGESGGPSITEWAISCLEAGESFGISSAHLDTLADIGNLETGLSLAVAAQKGRKYINNFKLLINKNMSRETYKKIPMAWLISAGLVAYWGIPPGESLQENDIPDSVVKEVNGLIVDQYRRDRKLGSVALGFVPGGTRPLKVLDAGGNLEALELPECYTGSFMTRCEGGIVVANMVGKNVQIGKVIETGRPKTKNDLIDEVNFAHASQASRLTGLPVQFRTMNGSYGEEMVRVLAAESLTLDF